MHFSKCTCEEGCLGILHAFSARSRSLCSSDSCSVTLDSIADETCSLSSPQSQCRDCVNAQIFWHSWQMTSNSAHMGLGGGGGQAEYLSFNIGKDRIGQCHQHGPEHTDTRSYDSQVKDSGNFPSSLSPGNRLFNLHPSLSKCVGRGSGPSETGLLPERAD